MSDIGKQVVALITDEIGNRDETIARLEKAMSWIAVGEGEPDYGTDTLVVCYGRRRKVCEG